jgi:hypothetical protein
MARVVTAADERYGHQLVAPQAVTVHEHPAWAERCYHLLYVDDDLMLNAGRAVHSYGGRRTAFAGVRAGGVEHAVRAVEPFAPGDDPDRPDVGPVRIEVVRPLQEVRLVLDAPGAPVAFDLTYATRLPPVATDPNVIEVRGELVTDYMNFYQSGRYSGTVSVDGREWTLSDLAGFRDRGWGIRKHEGAPRRGFVLFAGIELPDAVLYVLLYETASGRRAFTNGWIVSAAGVADTVTAAEHELVFEGTELRSGRLSLELASGAERTLSFDVRNRLFLSAVGYSADPDLAPVGHTRHDLADPAVLRRLDGQVDHGVEADLDGVRCRGFIETGVGVHARYRPDDAER